MKLHALTLKNFRAVRDVTVRPAEHGVTVIEGRNEAGKSSLGEALQMLLDIKDSSKKQQLRSTSPVDSGAAPEVAAEISSGPYRFSYSKRFLVKPQTTLQIDTPEPASLHGDEAHERVLAMLAETMDAELWAALRMEQGGSHALADLTRQSALSTALDQAAAGTSGDGSDEDLFSRVKAIFFEFYTRRPGYPEGRALKDLRAEVARLEQRVTELNCEQQLLDDQVEQARTLSRALSDQREAIVELRAERTQLQKQLETAQTLHQSVDRKRGEVALASAQSDTAKLALQARAGFVQRLEGYTRQLRALLQQSDAARPALQQAREQCAASKVALMQARQHTDESAAREREALAQQSRFGEMRELADLRHKLNEWRKITDRLRESRSFLAGCKVTPQSLQAARSAEATHRRLLEQVKTRAPKLEVTAVSPLELEQGGNVTQLAAGKKHRVSLGETDSVSIRNVATLRVAAGEDQAQREQAAAAAKRELDAALAALGAPTTALAETRLQERTRHEERKTALEEQQQSILGSASADEIEARIEALSTSLTDAAALQNDDNESLRAHLREARAAREEAEQRLRQAEQTLAEKSALKAELETAQLERSLHTDALREAKAALDTQLEKQRNDSSDASLTRKLAGLSDDLKRKQQALEAAQTEAASLPLDTARSSADLAKRVLADALQSLSERTTRLAELRSALTVREEKGLYEASAQAQAALAAASGELDNLLRQAAAARLLYETLDQARQQQRARYLLPLASKMQELGRVVFDDSFRVTLDDSLAIASRTLNGTTVPFELLSVGAREQLSVLQRVATALCVDKDDGVPLILDDVLGHADPERLRAMNAVLGLAGKRTQVIVTTCYPERYRHIDRALTITLP